MLEGSRVQGVRGEGVEARGRKGSRGEGVKGWGGASSGL